MEVISKSLTQSIVWYQNALSIKSKTNDKSQTSDTKGDKDKDAKGGDPRLDNLSGVLLSRFINRSRDNFHWHVLFGKIEPVNSKSGSIVTNH